MYLKNCDTFCSDFYAWQCLATLSAIQVNTIKSHRPILSHCPFGIKSLFLLKYTRAAQMPFKYKIQKGETTTTGMKKQDGKQKEDKSKNIK